jgi:hypothetical protein
MALNTLLKHISNLFIKAFLIFKLKDLLYNLIINFNKH